MRSEYRVFQVAFVGSLAVHTLVLVHWPSTSPWRRSVEQDSRQAILAPDIVSTEAPQPSFFPSSIQPSRAERPTDAVPPTGLEGRVKIAERAQRPPAEALVPEVSLPLTRPHKPAVPAEIDLSNLSLELGQNPAYLDYFHTIRERIRHAAQRNYSSSGRGGEVFVTFVVGASGRLQTARIDPARSVQDPWLLRMSLTSVQQAAPFASFPPVFNQPQITFHIIIAYEPLRSPAHIPLRHNHGGHGAGSRD